MPPAPSLALPLRTRFAPTPSGYLHVGNAFSFALTWLWARQHSGFIHLRIDGVDTARCRTEYIDDIFESLNWLGLNWDSGPKSRAEYESFTQLPEKNLAYRSALKKLQVNSRVYFCTCSREQIRLQSLANGSEAHLYSGTCRPKENPFEKGYPAHSQTPGAWRFKLNLNETTQWANYLGQIERQDATQLIGDFVVWTKEDQPAYQLVSVLDDFREGINFWVRGSDLIPSSSAQLALAAALGIDSFKNMTALHHPLICLGDEKLSKSAGSTSLKSMRARGITAQQIWKLFARVLGFPPTVIQSVTSAHDLLSDFKPQMIPTQNLDWENFKI